MQKKLLIVSAAALLAVFGLFMLPKVVVDNERNDADQGSSMEGAISDSDIDPEHSDEISTEARAELVELREAYESSKNSENFTNFANSLIDRFAAVNQYDSAAKYAAELAEADTNESTLQKAGDMYYEAFTYAMDADKSKQMGESARYFYELLLEQAPDQLDAKAKMAMTYVSSSSPMQGIQMLREVLEEDADNTIAVYNLGLLSMQSGQYNLAVERFEKLVSLEPDNLQAQFLLGVSYFEEGLKEKAKKQFEYVKSLDADPSVTASVDEYLNQL